MDADHYRLRDFLTRSAQPYEWHEAGTPEADGLLGSLGLTDATLPVLVDGEHAYAAATVETVARGWGGLRPPRQAHYDFVVIGAGAAGLAPGGHAPAGGPATPRADPDRPRGPAAGPAM